MAAAKKTSKKTAKKPKTSKKARSPRAAKKATKPTKTARAKSAKTTRAKKSVKATRSSTAAAPKRSARVKKATKAPARRTRSKPSATKKGGSASNGSAAFIEALSKRLDEHRREILHLYRHDLDVGRLDTHRDGDDEIDRANFDSDRDLALSLSDGEREVLLQIEEALRRLESGGFGSCTSCSKPIGELRLDAIPWARYCIDCQELEEKGLLG